MSGNRLIYQNWIVDLGGSPSQIRAEIQAREVEPEISPEQLSSEKERQTAIRREVAAALLMLTDDEREFIERFYYSGQTYGEIAAGSGRATHKLEAIHKRALKRLRKILQPTVSKLYGLNSRAAESCIICGSPHRRHIDRLIRSRSESETWKRVIRTLGEEYGIRIATPQILIGHEKYHHEGEQV